MLFKYLYLYYLIIFNCSTGGSWLITNMRRGESMFDVDPSVHDEIADGIKTEGSNLCGISAICSWEEINTIGL
jgi:suppressor of fused-like protein